MDQPDAAQARPDRRGAFLLLFFCLLSVGAGNTMLTAAVLPPLTRALELPDWTAGAIFSLSAAVWVVAAPYWGARSNRMGRRPVAAIGMAGFGASMFLFGLISLFALLGWISGWLLVFLLLLFARSLFGVFGSATNPAAQAYVADRTSREERTDQIATLTSGFTLGQIAGPAAAAVLINLAAVFSPTIGLLAPIFVITVVAFAIAWLVQRTLPENRSPIEDAGGGRPEATGLWRHPSIRPYLVYAVGLSLITGVLSQTFPYAIMDRMGVEGARSAAYTGPAMTMGAMATLIAQLVIIPRIRMSVTRLMIVGAALLSFSSLFMVWAQDFALFAFAQILFGFGQGLARPGFSAGASLAASHEQQGEVAGLVTAANGMGFVVSPIFGLVLYEQVSASAPFVFCTGLLLAMGLYAMHTGRKMAPPADARDAGETTDEAVAKKNDP